MERRKFTREFKLEAVRLIKERGVSYVQASQDLGVHVSQLHDWVKKFADDPEHAFPRHSQMKPEQLCTSTMPLPCFFNFSITDCLTCSCLHILKSKEHARPKQFALKATFSPGFCGSS